MKVYVREEVSLDKYPTLNIIMIQRVKSEERDEKQLLGSSEQSKHFKVISDSFEGFMDGRGKKIFLFA